MFRKNVSRLRTVVWEARDDRDAYTGKSRRALAEDHQNVDHVIEVQLIEFAAGDALAAHAGLAAQFCEVVNTPANLNVTSREINQAKKGPFTAALNRLKKRDGTLRSISVEQLARTGRAKWLVEKGVWARIEKETVASYDAVETRLNSQRLTRAHTKALEVALDNLHTTMETIKLF